MLFHKHEDVTLRLAKDLYFSYFSLDKLIAEAGCRQYTIDLTALERNLFYCKNTILLADNIFQEHFQYCDRAQAKMLLNFGSLSYSGTYHDTQRVFFV